MVFEQMCKMFLKIDKKIPKQKVMNKVLTNNLPINKPWSYDISLIKPKFKNILLEKINWFWKTNIK